ncbi:uncharacterized protein N7515_005735 [Penicillium bovifimosum]|uniref:Uncharacterized protein n=1 Tax=Penicillium bovifimosum TaxID=126998 RepID=A0A9W9L041_9EURO|nr:uncharacterized protein N7515_005735 [Penicillium bovifimosum]KAJ5129696.1 hypothetical protein N7515_005735 [Penicillium bovifimosum]
MPAIKEGENRRRNQQRRDLRHDNPVNTSLCHEINKLRQILKSVYSDLREREDKLQNALLEEILNVELEKARSLQVAQETERNTIRKEANERDESLKAEMAKMAFHLTPVTTTPKPWNVVARQNKPAKDTRPYQQSPQLNQGTMHHLHKSTIMPSPVQIEFTNLESPLDNSAELIQRIRASLSREATTENVKVKGLKMLPNNRVLVFVETRRQAETMIEHNEWSHAIEGCRMADKILFPIKVDSINRNHVFDAAGNISDEFYSSIGEENACTIPKAIWLSGKKAYGSLIAYVKQKRGNRGPTDLGDASVEEDESQFIKEEPVSNAAHDGELEPPESDATYGGKPEDPEPSKVKKESGDDATPVVDSDDDQAPEVREEPQEGQDV